MRWHELEEAAPELARRAAERLAAHGLALLGTLRRDGSPRISPVEPHLAAGELLFAAMGRTAKERDLLRDPRCVLHSLVVDPAGRDGELKLYGRADEVRDDGLREAAPDAWWAGRTRQEARVFALDVERAAFVEWNTARGLMTIHRWSPSRGTRVSTRPYP